MLEVACLEINRYYHLVVVEFNLRLRSGITAIIICIYGNFMNIIILNSVPVAAGATVSKIRDQIFSLVVAVCRISLVMNCGAKL